jgi:hypothetical protein
MFPMSEKFLSRVSRGTHLVESSFTAEIQSNVGHFE